MTTVQIAIRAIVVVVLVSLVAWLALRIRRLERRADEHETVIESAVNRAQPPPDDGTGRRKRHLRIVSIWLPLAAGLGWLGNLWRRHPGRWSVAALGTAAVVVGGLVATQPGTIQTPTAEPPAVHRTARTRPTTPARPSTPKRITLTRVPTGTPSTTGPGITPPTTTGPPTTRPPATSPLPTTDATTTPGSTTTTPTPTTTTDTPPAMPPLLCLQVNLPILQLWLGCPPPGSD